MAQTSAQASKAPGEESRAEDISFSTEAEEFKEKLKRHVVDYVPWAAGYFVNDSGETCRGIPDAKFGRTILIASGWAVIETILEHQTNEGIERSFVITGQPVGGDEFSFVITAKDASSGKLLRGELVNAFGKQFIGKLDLKVIQKLSKYTNTIKLVDRPQWLHNKLVAPGLNKDIKYAFEREIKIDFTAKGDAALGTEALETLFRIFDSGNVAITIAVMMGAPVIAYLWPGDRFTTFLTGLTGTHKTAFIQLLSCMFGEAYSQEINIVRWGHGATPNALEHLAVMTGPFPFVIDNYKNYTDKDPGKFQAVNQALCEGGEKKRLTKDATLRTSEEYQCMPVVTGENYPGQDAASRARTIMLQWTGATDLSLLAEAQKHIKDLNALGKEWCLWLSSDFGQDQIRQLREKFDVARSRYIKDTGDAVNAGRIATNAGIISLIWELLYNFPPMTELAEEVKEVVEEAIKTHITQSKIEIADDLDAERFRRWLQAEIEVGNLNVNNAPYGISEIRGAVIIGQCSDDDLLITPSVFRGILIPLWHKSTTGARADERSLLKQLAQRGYLEYDNTNQVFTKNRRLGFKQRRVYVFSWKKLMEDDTGEKETATEAHVAGKQYA